MDKNTTPKKVKIPSCSPPFEGQAMIKRDTGRQRGKEIKRDRNINLEKKRVQS